MLPNRCILPNIIPLFMLWASVLLTTEGLDYLELEDLGVSCPLMDSCKHRSREDLTRGYSCSCAPSCVSQDNCCIDYSYVNASSTVPKATCKKVDGGLQPVLIVRHCSSRWTGVNHIKDLCESSNLLLGNPIEIIPVTNPFSGVTYKNYFCSRCNYDSNEMVFWKVQVSSELELGMENLLKNESYPLVVQYDSKRDSWMYELQNENGSTGNVRKVSLHISPPEDLWAPISHCRLDVIKQCGPDWEDNEVKRKCESYTAVLAATSIFKALRIKRRRVFRNVHCAICNDVTDFGDAECRPYHVLRPELPESHSTVQPFSTISSIPSVTVWFGHLLLDRNCLNEREIYVDRLKGCRTIVCINPNHVIRNRRCVPP